MPGRFQVKCPICQQYFDRSVEEFVHFKNRYYHKRCFDQVDKIDIVGNLEINSFNNTEKIQVNLKDLRKSIS